MKKIRVLLVCMMIVILSLSLIACNGGEAGQQGQQGSPGQQGEQGQDGLTPHIGANGNWWIGDDDTGIFAGEKPPEYISVETVEAISIEFVNNPRNVYNILEPLDFAEYTIRANYIDGTTEYVYITPYMVSGFDNHAMGTRRVLFSYQNLTLQKNISIVDNTWDIVTTAEQFLSMTSTGRYILGRNIDFDGKTIEPLPTFSGVLEGNGNVLSNIIVRRTTDGGNLGLFNSISSGIVMNLGIYNIDIVGTRNNVGGLAGVVNNASIVSDVFVSGVIGVEAWNVGGIAGGGVTGAGTTIRNTISAVAITVSGSSVRATGTVGDAWGSGVNAPTITNNIVLGNINVDGSTSIASGTNPHASNRYYEGIVIAASPITSRPAQQVSITQLQQSELYMQLRFSNFGWDISGNPQHMPTFINALTAISLPSASQIGNAQNPIRISTAEDLRMLGGSALYFYLDNDIDLGGEVFDSIGSFFGNLNGHGYAISNFRLNANNPAFIRINTGTIRNINFINVVSNIQITGTFTTVPSVAIAVLTNSGTLDNISTSGTISLDIIKQASNQGRGFGVGAVGGLVAINSGTVRNIDTNVSITSSLVTVRTVPNQPTFIRMYATIYIGGIIGRNNDGGTLANSNSRGTIHSTIANGTAVWQYAFGHVTSRAGGLVGRANDGLVVANSSSAISPSGSNSGHGLTANRHQLVGYGAFTIA